MRAEGMLGHSDEPEEDAICIFNSPLGHCRPVGGPPRARVCSVMCPTLCDPPDCRPPGSSARGVSQARILEWGAVRKPPAAAPQTEPQGRTRVEGLLGGGCTVITSVLLCLPYPRCLSSSAAILMVVMTIGTQP